MGRKVINNNLLSIQTILLMNFSMKLTISHSHFHNDQFSFRHLFLIPIRDKWSWIALFTALFCVYVITADDIISQVNNSCILPFTVQVCGGGNFFDRNTVFKQLDFSPSWATTLRIEWAFWRVLQETFGSIKNGTLTLTLIFARLEPM